MAWTAVVAADGTLVYVLGVGAGLDSERSSGLIGRDRRRRSLRRGGRMSTRGSVPRASEWSMWVADQEDDLWVWDFTRLTLTRTDVQSGCGCLSGVDPRRSTANLFLGAGGRTESLLAGGRRHRNGRAADQESQRSAVHRRVA